MVCGKLLVSKVHREPVKELSRRLSIELEQWPSVHLTLREHDEEVQAILDSHVKNVGDMFVQLNLHVEKQRRYTWNIHSMWFD